MAAVENPKYEELCRLCATKTTMVLAINIFENEGSIRQISKKIGSCLPVQVHETDELPKMICENCLYKLELFCDFRDRSARTERLLVELYKELSTGCSHGLNEQEYMVTMEHNQLVMVQHHQLLADQNMHNVSQLDLSHLGDDREGMIVEHEIILSHDINAHSLDSIELNNHDLASQELSNQSLGTQESIIDSNHQFNDNNLGLIQQHHLLSEQFRIGPDLHVDISEEITVNSISLTGEETRFQTSDSSEICNERAPIQYDTVRGNSDLNEVHLDDLEKKGSDLNSFEHEDSNSANSLLSSVNVTDTLQTKEVYGLSIVENKSLVMGNDLSNGKEWYYCNICGRSFERAADFDRHYETHFYKCSMCLAVFTNLDVLNSHTSENHPKNDFKINIKEEGMDENGKNMAVKEDSDDSDYELDNNQVEEEEEEDQEGEEIIETNDGNKRKKWTPKVCKVCGKSYKTNYKLTEHMRKHTGEKPYKCKSCEKAFRSKIGLAQHEAKHTGQYDFSCPTCGKGFQCKSYLMVHQRVHSDVKPYPCTTCGQNFKTKQALLDHTNRHLGVKPYMCEVCGRGFITKGLCRAHQKIHSGLDNRKYPCKVCSKMFVSKSYLQTHLRIHTGEKPFICEVCRKGFLTRVDLKIHSTMHTGEKSYVCEMCGKAFARRDALRCHRRSHTGERPYSCDLCGQTFTQFTPMAIHRRLHTGERPYSCETCGKAFVSRSTMMSHMKKKHVR